MASPPKSADETRVSAVINHAHQQEECARGDTVIDVLKQSALQSVMVERENTQHDESQMAHTGIGHQFFEVFLHHGHQRAVYMIPITANPQT